MAKQTINVESGLVIRNKINDNFTELYESAASQASQILTLSENAGGSISISNLVSNQEFIDAIILIIAAYITDNGIAID